MGDVDNCPDETGPPEAEAVLEILNKKGLHARAAAKFVKLAGDYAAKVAVEKDGTSVCGTSIMGLMILAASKGTSIRVSATGPESQDVVDALRDLVGRRFDEE